ncbi:MAG: N-acetylmuramoyl-L-alanine amidase [Opitutaceae bacterium]|nr:N-acetylmuramoyl-L-alanine amidase [Opitutaceae bacterium]
MLRVLLGRWVVGCALLLGPVTGALAAPSPSGVVRLYDTEYVSAAEFGAQAGLKRLWLVPQKKLLLADKTRRLELEVDSRDFLFNGRRVFLGEPAVAYRNTIYISRIDRDRLLRPILDPRMIPGPVPGLRTVVIDPGHGGKDDGAVNPRLKLKEKEATLDVALRLERLLKAAGYRVLLTRRKDSFVPLPLRPAFAKSEKADLFISIHFNANETRTVVGTETYLLTPQHQRSTGSDRRMPDDAFPQPGNVRDAWNAVLGFKMHNALMGELQTFDRGLKRARFAVLRDLACPGLLVEGGYLSNDTEARKIATPEWRQRLAESLAEGVADYRAVLAARR